MESYPTFHNEVGVPIVRIGCRDFKCIGDKPPHDHPTSTLIWAMPVTSSAPIALRYSASIRAWAHTKLIRQVVLMVTGTELKSSNTASFVMPAAVNRRQAPSFPQSQGGSRWPRAIRIQQDASVTTAKPAIAVARDQVIYRVAGHPWDEWEDHVHYQRGSLARNRYR